MKLLQNFDTTLFFETQCRSFFIALIYYHVISNFSFLPVMFSAGAFNNLGALNGVSDRRQLELCLSNRMADLHVK